jgi:hypothetical protein
MPPFSGKTMTVSVSLKMKTSGEYNGAVLPQYSYSPFRQFWFMFAPSPPFETGYIGFDYIGNGNKENINHLWE